MSQPIRVAVVTGKYPPEYSGAGLRTHSSYLRILRRCTGLDLRVLCSGLEQRHPADYIRDGIPVHRIRPYMDPLKGRLWQGLAAWVEALQTFRWLQQQRPRLIHVVGACSVTAAAIAWARLRRVPLLIELVNAGASPVQSLPLLHRLWRPDLSRGTAIITISDALAAHCRTLGLDDNVWSRPNPVDTARFHPALQLRTELRRQLTPFVQDDIVLVSVAKFMPRKNQLFLLDVLALLPPRYKLVLAGPLVTSGPLQQRDRDYLEQIRARAAEADLVGRVQLVMEQVVAQDYIRLADAFLMPHRGEGLGTPMLESLACAVPVVANRGEAAFRQWLEDGNGGCLAPLQAREWVEAVQRAVVIPTAQRLSVAQSIRERAGEDVVDAQFLRLLLALSRNSAALPFSVTGALRQAA